MQQPELSKKPYEQLLNLQRRDNKQMKFDIIWECYGQNTVIKTDTIESGNVKKEADKLLEKDKEKYGEKNVQIQNIELRRD